jgi:hypothetical protein
VAGYAASGTLHGAVPRFIATGERMGHRQMPLPAIFGPVASGEPLSEAVPVDLVGRPLDAVIGDWLASVGESWSQLTFFLFDPDSWR